MTKAIAFDLISRAEVQLSQANQHGQALGALVGKICEALGVSQPSDIIQAINLLKAGAQPQGEKLQPVPE